MRCHKKRLTKQAVLGTYEKMKGRYPVSRTRNQNNPKDESDKQISQICKNSVHFKSNTSTGTGHLSAVTHSFGAMQLILKLNPSLATSTNLVSTKETQSQLEAEAEGQTNNLSSDCKAIMNILYPDVDYSSDYDGNELTYAYE